MKRRANLLRNMTKTLAAPGALLLALAPAAPALPPSLDRVPIPTPDRTSAPRGSLPGTHDLAEIIPPGKTD
ncbi:MAG: hypothetical protein HY900_38440, partial [Deltaproteobacteria bacterium]|nr:hypothetical protein [Deltaproteobacteria bacterium]